MGHLHHHPAAAIGPIGLTLALQRVMSAAQLMLVHHSLLIQHGIELVVRRLRVCRLSAPSETRVHRAAEATEEGEEEVRRDGPPHLSALTLLLSSLLLHDGSFRRLPSSVTV